VKGKDLYYDYYSHEDHEKIAELVTTSIRRQKWIVSYDNVRPIRRMYLGCHHVVYGVGYSAREVREGVEVMFFCDGLQIPPLTSAMRRLGA
jgi:DNA adenine methylase